MEPERPGESPPHNPLDTAADLAELAVRSQYLLSDILAWQAGQSAVGTAFLMSAGSAFLELGTKLLADPAKLWRTQADLWQDYTTLLQRTAERLQGREVEPIIAPEAGDRRFRHPEWEQSVVFDFIKQAYLLTARWLQSAVRDVEGIDPATAQKLAFYTRQFVDAVAPTNFPATNPEVVDATIQSAGENLVRGLQNLVADLERGEGRLHIAHTDPQAFTLGQTLAATPGKVVYQNPLMQLLQYEPSTEAVHRRPLLIIPPWINKYYILDLRPSNSLIKWLVDRGYTVFVISWVNPDRAISHKAFADYLQEGPLDALHAIEQALGQPDVNVIGYCIGGTLLSATLGYLAATEDDRVKSATYLATLVDFTEAGDAAVFIDEKQLLALEEQMERHGYLPGWAMHTTFNLLRANDLIWWYVVNNYLLGKEPAPFDILYWNADYTNMPTEMHRFYLRNMYLENRLVQPGDLTLAGVPIDLRRIQTPTYLLATKEDHIAPWQAVYRATQIYRGPVRFVLSGSGHVAGIVNPPAANKYSHWTNPHLVASPDAWLDAATETPGSWWTDWHRWHAAYAGDMVPARTPGDGALPVLEDAPGSYVQVRAD